MLRLMVLNKSIYIIKKKKVVGNRGRVRLKKKCTDVVGEDIRACGVDGVTVRDGQRKKIRIADSACVGWRRRRRRTRCSWRTKSSFCAHIYSRDYTPLRRKREPVPHKRKMFWEINRRQRRNTWFSKVKPGSTKQKKRSRATMTRVRAKSTSASLAGTGLLRSVRLLKALCTHNAKRPAFVGGGG